MKKILAIGLAAAGVLTFAGTANAGHAVGDLTIGLNGANEVGTKGDPNGSGKISLEFYRAAPAGPNVVFAGQPYVCYSLTVRNIDAPTGLHIHEVDGKVKNPRKDTGDVRVNLLVGAESSGDTSCVAVLPGVFEGILDNPSEYYVNVHNGAFSNGAIRGQLHAFS